MERDVRRILIAEDDLALRPLWEVVIRRSWPSAHIYWAVSCEEARRIIRTSPSFQVVISDLFLAGSETGVELLKSQEVTQSGASTVLVSVADEDHVREFCKQLPEHTVLITKPLNVVKCERAMSPIFPDAGSVA